MTPVEAGCEGLIRAPVPMEFGIPRFSWKPSYRIDSPSHFTLGSAGMKATLLRQVQE